jgi:hypothetical protein
MGFVMMFASFIITRKILFYLDSLLDPALGVYYVLDVLVAMLFFLVALFLLVFSVTPKKWWGDSETKKLRITTKGG